MKEPRIPARLWPKNRRGLAGFRSTGAFALVATLLLICILFGIVTLLASVVTSHVRGSTSKKASDYARQSALVGLDIAIGELQAAAGPDQRVTATADILQTGYANVTPAEGRSSWTGVWDTTNYDPTNPATKTFLRWLVSSSNGTGSFQMPTSINEPQTAPAANDILIFKGKDAASSVRVPRVLIDSVPEGNRSFAFWVEDEGVKADLRWKEGNFTDTAQKQAARLSVAPGPDYGRFNWPNAVGYPLAAGSSGSWLANLSSASDSADTQPITGGNATWLRDNRRDFTVGSRGVLADVKAGGLRRDLSLAFEMDGSQDDPALLTRFNNTPGEFVGTGNLATDSKTALYYPYPGATFYERHLYRFVPRTDHVVRGPCWHALRDFYNLYKRIKVSGTGGGYNLDARASLPMWDSGGFKYDFVSLHRWIDQAPGREIFKHNWYSNQDIYFFAPLRGNCSPFVTGIRFIASVAAVDVNPATGASNLAICIDPVIYLWNPWNVSLSVPRVTVNFGETVPIRIACSINGVSCFTANLEDILRSSGLTKAGSSTIGFNYTLTDNGNPFSMAPGEVMIFSPPPPSPSPFSPLTTYSKAYPGYNLNPLGGYTLTKFPVTTGNSTSNTTISLNGTETIDVGFGFSKNAAGVDTGRFVYSALLGTSTGNTTIHEHYMNLGAPKDGETITPGTLNGITASSLVNRKYWIGQITYSAKPSVFDLAPVEVFGRFNPAAMSWVGQPWRYSAFDRFFFLSYNSSLNALLTAGGQQIDADSNRRGYWGKAYNFSGSSYLPMLAVPFSPPLSLAAFRHAPIQRFSFEPLHAVGNSLSNPYLPGNVLADMSDYNGYSISRIDTDAPWCFDSSWCINDALWDRYYLSGLVPDFRVTNSGYSLMASSADAGIKDAVTKFFSAKPMDAKANPVLVPCFSSKTSLATVISDVSGTEGYKRLAAYSMIDGAFNVNSTSVAAWAAFLGANRDVAIRTVDPATGTAGNDSAKGVPTPKSAQPAGASSNPWLGFRRLTPQEIWDDKGTAATTDDTGLAPEIVKQVRLRGPFQSLSDFVNRQLSTGSTGYWGAVQAAIQATGLNSAIAAEGVASMTSTYKATSISPKIFRNESPGTGNTASDINGWVAQADLLEPIAPRLAARSDTFRIRSYGEVRSATGSNQVVSRACCEAVVQRVPEYMDPTLNQPWDEGAALKTSNAQFGRRFKIVQLRWLNPDEL